MYSEDWDSYFMKFDSSFYYDPDVFSDLLVENFL